MPRSCCREEDPRRDGFVLVLTLVLIAIAATLLARLATRSLAMVDEATVRQRNLQEKWAITSCRLALLSRSEELFAEAAAEAQEGGRGWPAPAQLGADVRLAGATYQLLLADEDAKANLNAIDRDTPGRVLQVVAAARMQSGGTLPSTLLRPLIAGTENHQFRPYRSWGQLLDLSQLQVPPWSLAEGFSSELTLWGSGRLNLVTASDEAVELLLGSRLPASKTAELLVLRKGWTDDLAVLLESEDLELTRRERILLRSLLTDKSSAYSLWIKTTGHSGRESLQLMVSDPSDRLAQRVQTFSW